MTQAFYRKWRPQTWDAVVGQDQVIQTLRNAVRGARTGHAYLFAGPRGTGKTSTARLLAKALNCTYADPAERPCNQCDYCKAIQEGRFLDLIEIDAASNTSVEDVRDLRDKINFSPNQGRYKVYIIDEVHMLSTAAFNALLKTLEEPPPHAVFILATTEVHKIPATVLSRCQRHEFRRLPASTIVPYLEVKINEEGLHVDREVLPLIARQATGSLRDAISLLDQLASTGDAVTLQLTREVLGTATNEAVVEVFQAVINNNPAGGLEAIQRALDSGTDPRQFSRQVVDYLHGLLLVKMGTPDLARSSLENPEEAVNLVADLPLDFLLSMISMFQEATQEKHVTRIPSLPLEISFLEGILLLHEGKHQPSSATDVQASPRKETNLPEQTAPSAATEPVPVLSNGKPQKGPSSKPDAAAGGSSSQNPKSASATAIAVPQRTAAPGQEFETIRREWKRFLHEVRQRDPILQGLINSGKPLSFENGALILGFETDLLREKMMKPDKLELAQAALEAILGFSAGIRCVLSGQWSPVEAGQEAGGYKDEGIVATAVREFGAQVVEVEDIPALEADPED
ncbi:MAG: DNA polymerase III subunit gamma/tau [Anaerolineales bacterium]|nr:DNA polymerase III subunit gamma/tau [Anaerolineales bacterium]